MNFLVSKTVLSAVSILSKIAVRAGTFIVIAPLIGPANQGTIVVASTWAGTVLLIMAYGFQVRVLREVAIDTTCAHSILVSDLRSMAALVIPSAMAATAIGSVAVAPEDRMVFAILLIATVGSIVGDYCASALRSLDRFRREAVLSLTTSVLQMVLVIGAALVSPSLIVLASAMVVSRTVYAAVSLRTLFTVEVVRASRSMPSRPVVHTLREAFPFFVDASLSVLLNGIDVLLLNHFVTKDIIGNYAVGGRIVQLFLVFPWIATNVLVPALVRAGEGPAFRREFAKLLIGMVAVALVGVAVLTIGGPIFVDLILGAKFSDLNAMWPAFAVLIVVRFVESSFGIAMTALGRMKARVWVQVGATLSITTIAVALLGRYGINGFVLGIAATYCLVGAYYAFDLRKQLTG